MPEVEREAKYVEVEPSAKKEVAVEGKTEFIQEVIADEAQQEKQEIKEPKFAYPVNISPAGEVEPKIESDEVSNIATIIGRFYLWQKQDEDGGLMELQADNAVVFRSGKAGEQTDSKEALDMGPVRGIYVSGNVVMTEGARTIRAEELYYDFENKRALIINAEMRNFDTKRGIPVYVRAKRLRQVSENKFAAENITLTSSEFYQPQISSTVSKIIITDLTNVTDDEGQVGDDKYDARMHDVRLKVGKKTIFYWPFMRSNLERPDIPIKTLRVGHDSRWGTSVESRWHLSRLLGLKEPEGVESTLALDHFGKRGTGVGAQIEYGNEEYYGNMLGYVINDRGDDRLGSHTSRQNLEPDDKLRGRFSWVHRHFLPYNWQFTGGIGYASDENFIEGYYRGEYNIGAGQETYVHLKRIEDNWGLSLLAKGRINDFADVLEEMPSAEFHLTGQSLADGKFTLYSDTQVSRLQQKIGDDHSTLISQEQFTFISHRTEVDMPIFADPFKIVPYVAGTFGYDDRSGFTRTLVDGSNSGAFGEEQVWLGELGIRIFCRPLWKVYPNVKSRLWDLNQLRHIIEPSLTAAVYAESNKAVRQRDTINFGIFQRLQTKRGPAGEQRTVDWMRFDTDITFVDDPADAEDSGPDQFIWAKPIVPMRVFSAPEIFGGDLISGLPRFEMFGPKRNYISTDYVWRVSDTSAILSDMNYDMQSGVIQQFNIGVSRLLWPNMSYYVGSRYLRRVNILDEKGSNMVNFALTYVLDPRYTVVLSQEWDFDYGQTVRSDITLIRKYHRLHCAFTYSADESLDRQAIVFSIWPEGIKELAIGKRNYVGIGGSAGY